MVLTVNTRPNWHQSVQGNDLAVMRRMQQMAAGESLRLPSREIVVSAHVDGVPRWRLHWPVLDLAYWVTG